MEAMEIVEWRMERLLCLSERERKREMRKEKKILGVSIYIY